MATFKPVVFAGDKHKKSDGTKNIKIRVYHNKDSRYIPTPYYIEEEYLGKDGSVLTSYQNFDTITYELGDMVQKFRGVCIKLGSVRSGRMTVDELRDYLTAAIEPEYEYIDFISFGNTVISETKKERTAEWYSTSLSVLCWFYKRSKIDVRDITAERMTEFINKLKEEGPAGLPLEPGAISNYLRGIRSLYNKAKLKYNKPDFDIIRIPNCPFDNVEIPIYRRKKKALSIDVVKKIRDTEFGTKRANMARDVFMAMFYLMGINANDLYRIEYEKNGRYEYERSKTDTDDKSYNLVLSIKIEPELRILIERYSCGTLFSYFRQNYSNAKNFTRAVNKGLEQISDTLNIPKFTTNYVRHTWASIARNKAHVSMADVDICLGHVNKEFKMADIYIDFDYTVFDTTNKAVLSLLRKKEKKEKKQKNKQK